jgi:hypothetical protein
MIRSDTTTVDAVMSVVSRRYLAIGVVTHDARFSICALDVSDVDSRNSGDIRRGEALVDSGDGGYGKICSNFNGIECRMLDFMADVCIVSNRIGIVATLRTFRMSASKSPDVQTATCVYLVRGCQCVDE